MLHRAHRARNVLSSFLQPPQHLSTHLRRTAARTAATAMDVEEFRKQAKALVDEVCDYYEHIEKYKVLPDVQPGYLGKLLPDEAPEDPESFDAIKKDFDEKIMPGITHWQHPMNFSYYPANTSYPAFLGEMLSNMLGVVGFSWICSPACTELETISMNWLGKLIGLPAEFLAVGDSPGGGVIQGTASEGVVVSMLAARARRVGPSEQKPVGDEYTAEALDRSLLVAYGSDQACLITGNRYRSVETDELFAIDTADLLSKIKHDIAKGLTPFFVCATIGTTSSGAVDDIEAVGKICREHNIWLHVDAAYAGSAMVSPEHRHHMKGIEYVDSFSFNPHKWLLVNFDCSALWVRQRKPVLDALSVTRPYYRNAATDSGLVTDYRDWQLPLGRRFRSLKLWFVMRSFGANGIREHIRKHIQLADHFHALVKSQPSRFEIVVPQSYALVCFRAIVTPSNLVNADAKLLNSVNHTLCERLNATGAFVTSTDLRHKYVIRVVPHGQAVEKRHMDGLWQLINIELDKILDGTTQLVEAPTGAH